MVYGYCSYISLVVYSLGDCLLASGSVPGPDGRACQTLDLSSDPVRPAIVSFSMSAEADPLPYAAGRIVDCLILPASRQPLSESRKAMQNQVRVRGPFNRPRRTWVGCAAKVLQTAYPRSRRT
jgi:hypothetical protein